MLTCINSPVLTATAAGGGAASTIIMFLLIILVAVVCVIIKTIKSDSAKQIQPKAPSALEKADKLVKLKELLDANIITQEEFDAKKKDIIK